MALSPFDGSLITREICALAPVVPVLTIHDLQHARPLAEALVAGGLPALEVTLRTPVALDAIRVMTGVPGARVGAGTLVTPENVRAAKAAGATFGVSPGATGELLMACETEDLPLLPGVATASEAMKLLARGHDMLKFFPAEASGGIRALRAIGAPLPWISFCPTGGIGPGNVREYLRLPNVLCAGGSWVAPPELVGAGRWGDLEALAREAAQSGNGPQGPGRNT